MIIEVSFLMTFCLLYFIFIQHTKSVGLYLSIFTLFFSNFLICTANYTALFMVKAVFISFTALCIFCSIIYKCMEIPVNKYLTWLVRLNIFILIFTISDIYLQGLLFLSTITVPHIEAKNCVLNLEPIFIPVYLWVFLVTLTLFWFYNYNIYFKNNNSIILTLFSLFIPFIMHFYNNTYFESRAILLCLTLIFDIFNQKTNILKCLWFL